MPFCLLLHNYYEQMVDIGEELQENNGNFFSVTNLRFFKLFTDKASRLANNTHHLRESLMQVRENYDTALGFNQSQIMKALAVLTAIFAPLSLITNWYGMNFENMPMLQWEYGPYAVIGFSVVAVCFCLGLIWRNSRRL